MSNNLVLISKEDIQEIIINAVESSVKKALSDLKLESDTPYISVEEAAELIGRSVNTINNYRKSGVLNNYIKMGHSFRYSQKEIERLGGFN